MSQPSISSSQPTEPTSPTIPVTVVPHAHVEALLARRNELIRMTTNAREEMHELTSAFNIYAAEYNRQVNAWFEHKQDCEMRRAECERAIVECGELVVTNPLHHCMECGASPREGVLCDACSLSESVVD